ncbi:Transglutaminase-like domain-containing protein [Tenacibaculum insulae]
MFTAMVKFNLLFLSLFFCINSFSQDLKRVDQVILSYQKATSIESLAKRIDYDFKTKTEKVRAIYTWIALNIEYDYYNTKSLKPPQFITYTNNFDLKRIQNREKKEVINKTFNDKKGICNNYALLFNKLCNLINLDNELVLGYVKSSINEIGIIPFNKNHIWNAVKINEKWMLFDATYGSGYVYKDVWQQELNLEYFNVKKEKLRLTHFPSDKKWQTFLNQKPLATFCYEPFYQNAFLKYNVEILEPKIGEIKIIDNKKIHLKIKKSKNTNNIKYFFSHENIIKTPKIKNRNLITDLYFPNPNKDTYLHIYIENELALQYKIKL